MQLKENSSKGGIGFSDFFVCYLTNAQSYLAGLGTSTNPFAHELTYILHHAIIEVVFGAGAADYINKSAHHAFRTGAISFLIETNQHFVVFLYSQLRPLVKVIRFR